MGNKEQLAQLQARQVELLSIMAESDAHAAKCIKLGKKFSTEYPSEKVAYEAANAEFNSNEQQMAELEAAIAAEEAEMNQLHGNAE